jgi:hypothetical protein
LVERVERLVGRRDEDFGRKRRKDGDGVKMCRVVRVAHPNARGQDQLTHLGEYAVQANALVRTHIEGG